MLLKLLSNLLLLTLCVTSSFTGADEGQHNALLRTSSSPYLQLHVDNPVAWVPYTPRVIPDAEKKNKLLFLSIGYSTCHWCHVMNRESFQDEEVARVLNTSYTAIKMDREQYPDADQYYNDLLVLSGGTAGWPLSGILLPDGTPLWLGNYLSKEKLIRFLEAFAGHFERGSPDIDMQAGIYRELVGLKKAEEEKATNDATPFDIDEAGRELLAIQDPIYGGVKGEQKFPNPDNIEKLWWFYDKTGDKQFKTAALRHLDGMLEGTLYDPLYGGFFRYATQKDWTAPHFEKLLITQANMLRIYSEAFERTEISRYQEVASDLYYMLCTVFLDSENGYFYSATDSEYRKVNGGNYLLSKQQIGSIDRSDEHFGYQQYGEQFIIKVKSFDARKLRENRIFLVKNQIIAYTKLKIDKKIISEWNLQAATALLNFAFLAAPTNAVAQDAKAKALRIWLDITETIHFAGETKQTSVSRSTYPSNSVRQASSL